MHLLCHHGCIVVCEKNVQNHQVLSALPPHHGNAKVKPEGDDEMQKHEDSDGTGAQGVTIHDDM
jgi:hypothetical protein